jgi:hypothetical protein
MKILSFELTMPNVGSWNGQWTGADRKYYVINSVSDKYLKSKEHFKKLLEKGRDSWYYNFGDGWGANVSVQIIDSIEARKRRKLSKGFAGYDWMIDSSVYYGEILNSSQGKEMDIHDSTAKIGE